MHAGNLLLLIVTFSISAKAFAWPNWVYQANCGADYFCAVGIADSEVTAKQIAFDDLSLQLQASVSSQSVVSIRKQGSENSSTMSKRIKLTTESIPLNLVSIAEKSFENNQIALLIKLSKSQFYNNLVSRLNTFFDNITTSTQLNQQPIWQQRVWALRQWSQQSKIENHLVLLSSISSIRTDSLVLWEKFRQWQQLTSKHKNVAIIEVQAPQNLGVINASINRYLIGGSGTVYWLQPSIKHKIAKNGNEFIVEAVLSVQLLESEPPYRVLFTNTLKERQSASSKNQAKQRATEAIAHLIENSKGQVIFNKTGQNSVKEYL